MEGVFYNKKVGLMFGKPGKPYLSLTNMVPCKFGAASFRSVKQRMTKNLRVFRE